MPDWWFDPTFYAWFGALAGGVGGTLAGLFAGLSVLLVRRNQGRMLVFGGCVLFLILALIILGYGLAALVAGKPWSIWWGPVYGGGVSTAAFCFMIPLMRKRYRQAEEQRLQAEGPGRSSEQMS